MATVSLHPDLRQLQAFAMGTLDGGSCDTIGSHLASCPACQAHVAAAAADSFVGSLRRAHARSTTSSCSAAGADGPPTAQPRPLVMDSLGHARPRRCVRHRRRPTAEYIPEGLVEHPRYRIVRLLGKGGMGSVYEAEHRLMQRRVALKVINDRYFAAPDIAARFRREVRAAARLSHRNIVTAYDAERAKNNYFLVMEFVEGITIGRLVKDTVPCRWPRRATMPARPRGDCNMPMSRVWCIATSNRTTWSGIPAAW